MIYIFGVIVNLAIGIWMYRDAESEGNSGIIWGVFGFCLPVLALIIYGILNQSDTAWKILGSMFVAYIALFFLGAGLKLDSANSNHGGNTSGGTTAPARY